MNELTYRPQALQRFSSPERLDQLLKVTGGTAWVALVALSLAIGAGLIWSIFGRVPINVTGGGLIQFHVGGTRATVAQGTGVLTDVLVAPGDYVARDQVIARLDMTDVKQQLRDADALLAGLTAERARLTQFYGGYLQDQKRLLASQQDRYKTLATHAGQRTQVQQSVLQGYEKLRQAGFATVLQEESARERYMSAIQDRDTAETNALQLDTQRQSLVGQRNQALQANDEKLINAQGQVNRLREMLRVGAEVRSPVAGRVVQFEAQPHTLINSGSTVALIEFGPKRTAAIVYVPATDGKLIAPGMTVKLSPTTVKPEQYGSILGRVESVGEYPATPSDMMRVLNNQTLVTTFAANGSPLEVLVSLRQNPRNVSGLEWTSAGGSPLKITSGTLASARIAVQNDPPIKLVIPFFRRFTGV